MTDNNNTDFEKLSDQEVANSEMERIYAWLRKGVSPKSIAAKCRMSLAQLELKLQLHPELKANWDEAIADYEIYHVDAAHDAATNPEAPLALKVKYHSEQLKKLEHHATKSAPQVVIQGKAKDEALDYTYAPLTDEELAAVERRINSESDGATE